MTDLAPPTDGRLRPTILAFGLAYLLASALVTIVLVIFNLDAPGGVAIGVLVGSTAIAARSFVVGNRRAMIRAEQLRFALLGVGVVLLLSLLQIAVLVPLIIRKSRNAGSPGRCKSAARRARASRGAGDRHRGAHLYCSHVFHRRMVLPAV